MLELWQIWPQSNEWSRGEGWRENKWCKYHYDMSLQQQVLLHCQSGTYHWWVLSQESCRGKGKSYHWWKKNRKMSNFNSHLTVITKLIMALYSQSMVKSFLHLQAIDGLGTWSSCHISNNDDGMFDVEIINETVHVSSGTSWKEECAN